MAITPRTIFSEPANLVVFGLGVLAAGALLGTMVDAELDASAQSGCPYVAQQAERAQGDLDAGAPSYQQFEGPQVAVADAEPRAWACTLQRPAPEWGEAEWLRHLDCMEARGESNRAVLDSTDAAIEAVGLTHTLALRKDDSMKVIAGDDTRIAFLDSAIAELGHVDGQLAHRLARTMTWRGQADDLERVRRLHVLSRTLMPSTCEVIQTDIWVRYQLVDQKAHHPNRAAWQGVRSAVDTYLDRECHERVHEGEWAMLAEIVGVGVAAEATNGHSGHSTLIADVAESFELRHVGEFCKEAVPADAELRSYCKKRVEDELYLSRR